MNGRGTRVLTGRRILIQLLRLSLSHGRSGGELVRRIRRVADGLGGTYNREVAKEEVEQICGGNADTDSICGYLVERASEPFNERDGRHNAN